MSPASESGEVLYADDLPGCCQRSARSAGGIDRFECPSCGALWQDALRQDVMVAAPEECAFTERASDRERKGAA